jgi:peptidoglycan/xylan/chitin deacetylase (PgdA/CDA1 family)
MDQIDNTKELTYELNHSAQRIKNELGEFPKTISYPNGNYNNKVIDLAKVIGYSYGLAVKQRSFNPKTDNLFEIPRIELYKEPMWKTKLRISGSISRIKNILGR